MGMTGADVAILLLAVSLGDVVRAEIASEPIPASPYVALARPWLALGTYLTPSQGIKALQGNLLLIGYMMWTMRHWDAWCLIDSIASLAEKLMTRYPHIIDDGLNHRVLWAVAKMQLELSEECQIQGPCLRQGHLTRLIQSTSLPQPPLKTFQWPGVRLSLHHDTWYYYLAETSSRRLVERIKTELYPNSVGASSASWLSAALPLACELERQVEEWMNSLPDDFQHDPDPEEDELATPSVVGGASSSHIFPARSAASPATTVAAQLGMRKILRNRMWQLQTLIYKPFLAAAAASTESSSSSSWSGETRAAAATVTRSGQPTTSLHTEGPLSSLPALQQGAVKCLIYATSFLLEQPPLVERHYGGWLLARNAWAVALGCLAALQEPTLQALVLGARSNTGGGIGAVGLGDERSPRGDTTNVGPSSSAALSMSLQSGANANNKSSSIITPSFSSSSAASSRLSVPSHDQVLEAVGQAGSILWQWRHENQSLAAAGRILTHMVQRTKEQAAAQGLEVAAAGTTTTACGWMEQDI
ncbi:uncharacterized protein B0I36DRAFT_40951 [Microdochium trichocladiopsis]|uniref:Uncharacterized protein n=1 Tax=Microdochium trichocladiopsis TaxID=1682393 RepID=A0A9P9BJZ5_9PEZI|nr:uncharacterized protein B0I36DRAFT_40951 [Microdochium trichocladiopsis]KAH7018585.1 hypothetical protein B0I36DRAFT_40951 [Microdochium trichocladiopsis]